MSLKPIDVIKSHLIDKLKYVFNEANTSFDYYNINKSEIETIPETKPEPYPEPEPNNEIKSELNKDATDNSPNNDDELNKLYNLFKKIKLLFIILSDMFKFIILHVDDERYQKIECEKIKFPKTIDELILIIGCYGDAFTVDMQEDLLNILDNSSFKDLYTISEIPNTMIPFVADDNINLKLLTIDYLKFSNDIKNIACNILKVNTDFDEISLIECT